MDVDDGGLAARQGVVARGAEGHAFVQRHDVTQLRIVEQRIQDRALRGAGIAEDVLDPVRDEALHQDLLASHQGLFSSRYPGSPADGFLTAAGGQQVAELPACLTL
jgi:hypothetical protein